MTLVIKRNGGKEEFDPWKVRSSIKRAVISAGLSLKQMKDEIEEVSSKVIKMTKSKTEIETKAIRNKILNEFDIVKKSVAEAWRIFDRKYKQ